MIKKEIVVNGVVKHLVVDAKSSLASVIRGNLTMTGTKIGCGQGQCGACSVIMDGQVIRSCATKMKRVADGARITTIEGIGTPTACIRCRWPGSPMAGPSAVSVRRALSSRPRACSTPISAQLVMKYASGSINTAMPAAAPVTSNWSMLSWMRPRSCAAR